MKSIHEVIQDLEQLQVNYSTVAANIPTPRQKIIEEGLERALNELRVQAYTDLRDGYEKLAANLKKSNGELAYLKKQGTERLSGQMRNAFEEI
jgi:hypothetical protein